MPFYSSKSGRGDFALILVLLTITKKNKQTKNKKYFGTTFSSAPSKPMKSHRPHCVPEMRDRERKKLVGSGENFSLPSFRVVLEKSIGRKL